MFRRNVAKVIYLCVLLLETTLAAVRYDGHKVLRVTPKSPDQSRVIQRAQRMAQEHGLDIWRAWNGVDGGLDIRVSPADYSAVVRHLDELDLKHDVFIDDVQKSMDSQTSANGHQASKSGFDYAKYNRLEEIDAWLDVTQNSYPNITEVVKVSTTFEGRTIRGLLIDTKKENSVPGIWIQAALHAREWIGPAVVLYMTQQMLDAYGKSDSTTEVVDSFKWVIIPVVNQDGYVYSWNEERMWRKTRSKYDSDCVGVDPNRNWDYKWAESGSSSDPCSDVYHGPQPFSEPCVKGLKDYMEGSDINFKGFLDIHSYSQLWMSPWGYSKVQPVDYKVQDGSSIAATEAIKKVHGTEYEHGTIGDVIYLASGNSVDWSYGRHKITFSAAVELRDNGTYGFLLPCGQIVPTGEETLQGLLAYAKYVDEH